MVQDPRFIESSKQCLTNPYVVAMISPGALLALGTLGKGIMKGFSRRSLYLGFDAGLTAVYSGMVYLYDLARDQKLFEHDGMSKKLEVTAGFLILSFVLFFVVIGLHRAWDREDKDYLPVPQFAILGVICNVLGFGLLAAFVLLVKGVV